MVVKKTVKVVFVLLAMVLLITIILLFANSNKKSNPYFFEGEKTEMEYEGFIYPLSCEEIREDVILKINKLDSFKDGELYTLELAQLDVEDPEDKITMGRQYLGYFYVNDTQIFRIPVKDYEGFTEEQTQDIVALIREDEKSFLDKCHIVCSEDEVKDAVDEQGYHSGVKVEGEQRTYYYYNENTSGTKDYEQIVWERGKGIVYYMRGAGSRLMHVEFGVNLSERIDNAYALLNNTEMQMLVETSFDEQEIANNKQLHYNTFETAQTAYSGELFPQELILECQDVLHKTFESGKDVTDANGEYLQWLESLGGMDYMLTLEEIYELFPMTKEKDFVDIYDAYAFISGEEYCTGIFSYKNQNGQNEYVLCVDSNGSYGNYIIYIAEYTGNKFVLKNSFEAQGDGLGRVISYEDNFYYVLLQYNDNLKNFDGVKIHKLDGDTGKNNIRIRYIPNEYAWETVHVNSDFPKSEYKDIDLYIQSIQQEITEGNYLEKGKPDGEWDCFMGDEVQDDSFPLTTEFEQYVKADLANVGMDVFLQKKIFLPSSSSYTAYFKTDFYLHDCENNEIMQLDKIKINNNASNQLIQMWFKRIGNKIYTFKIHHLKDYDYLLEVVLVEGSQITRIRQDLITAIRHFELLERHVLNTGI